MNNLLNLRGMLAEDAFDEISQINEGADWEYKGSGSLFEFDGTLKDKHRLTLWLGKQVSAFANTEGGNLFIGVNENKEDQTLEKDFVPLTWKGQPIADFLRNLIKNATDYPVTTFEIVPLKSTNDPQRGLLWISVGMSPTAPHQLKEGRQYYWRYNSESEPAPHFHLENIRNRLTRTVLEIGDIVPSIGVNRFRKEGLQIDCHLIVSVVNTTMQIATPWVVVVDNIPDGWTPRGMKGNRLGAFFSSNKDTLMPRQEDTATVTAVTRLEKAGSIKVITDLLSNFSVRLRAVSQDHVSDEVTYTPPISNPELRSQLEERLRFCLELTASDPLP